MALVTLPPKKKKKEPFLLNKMEEISNRLGKVHIEKIVFFSRCPAPSLPPKM